MCIRDSHQHAVEWSDRSCRAYVVGILERHDAAEREVRARRECTRGFVGTAREAVEHRARGNTLFGEHAEGVVPRVARVDHERATEPVRELDVRTEGGLLL